MEEDIRTSKHNKYPNKEDNIQPKIKQSTSIKPYKSITLCVLLYQSSTLYVEMVWEKNGHPYISIASDELKSLLKL